MVRAQVVLDDAIAARLRAHAAATGTSMSAIVRDALTAYLGKQDREPDTSFVGKLGTNGSGAHDVSDIRASARRGLRRAARP
jgi:plasmid stability protein